MEFRLTYEGPLYGASNGNTRASHKHDIRRVFHRQLRQFWQVHPFLRNAPWRKRLEGHVFPTKRWHDHLAEQWRQLDYTFIPLVSHDLSLICGLDILFMRPGTPGEILRSGDIDNRLKTLFDALRMPANKDELGGNNVPTADETPFYCLLTDDKLVAHVSVETDILLEPTKPDADDNDCRLVIRVKLKPFDIGWDNLNFS